jgi:hypothetical protein
LALLEGLWLESLKAALDGYYSIYFVLCMLNTGEY